MSAAQGEIRRSEAKRGETDRFVWPPIRRSNATAAKPAISPNRGFSTLWPHSDFAVA
jgi:hypothetical protein